MISPYKRRRSSSLIRNLWVYRRLVAAAIVLGVMLWFIVINHDAVTVRFPFGLGQLQTSSGIAILLGALAGSVVTALIMTVILAVRRLRSGVGEGVAVNPTALPEDRPPSDYASKTTEGFSDAPWSAR
jgi:uncharacterized integral membrane protein